MSLLISDFAELVRGVLADTSDARAYSDDMMVRAADWTQNHLAIESRKTMKKLVIPVVHRYAEIPRSLIDLDSVMLESDPIIVPPSGLMITSVDPMTATVGSPVKITGVGFVNVESVSFTVGDGFVDAVFRWDSDTELIATVPSGAESGEIRVLLADGRSALSDPIIVQPGYLAFLNGRPYREHSVSVFEYFDISMSSQKDMNGKDYAEFFVFNGGASGMVCLLSVDFLPSGSYPRIRIFDAFGGLVQEAAGDRNSGSVVSINGMDLRNGPFVFECGTTTPDRTGFARLEIGISS